MAISIPLDALVKVTRCQFKVNVAEVIAVPPWVTTPIGPVLAPVGTVAVICVSEFTVNCAGVLSPKPTPEVCVKPVPVIDTCVPTDPLGGLNPRTCGVTRNP